VVLKYGTDNISVCVFPCESEQHALDSEVALIAQLRGLGFTLTNMTDGGEGVSGLKCSPEVIAKRGAAIKAAFAKNGKVNPPSQREAARRNALGNKNCVGRIIPEEQRRKISASLKGNKCALGHSVSDEVKQRLRARSVGNKYAAGHSPSAEVRAEWSRKRKGVKWTDERKAKAGRKGKPWSEARRAAQNSRLGVPRNAQTSNKFNFKGE
jgi:hypothetical protein